ncbi:DUF6255 family natural product biosynthesis protein [Streptomyces sp. NPDC049577]|uniref:DUF6255 family natural product biosynthesis protein n=1 Tax=Streptomyces sp. NPDC049577 TaxID=3155153 RepID=UPI00342A1960
MPPLAAVKGTCPSPDHVWASGGGVKTCTRCGTRRFLDYRALTTDLSEPAPPRQAMVMGTGTLSVRAWRHPQEALRKRLRELNRHSARGRP